jgi:hypothetical protein
MHSTKGETPPSPQASQAGREARIHWRNDPGTAAQGCWQLFADFALASGSATSSDPASPGYQGVILISQGLPGVESFVTSMVQLGTFNRGLLLKLSLSLQLPFKNPGTLAGVCGWGSGEVGESG